MICSSVNRFRFINPSFDQGPDSNLRSRKNSVAGQSGNVCLSVYDPIVAVRGASVAARNLPFVWPLLMADPRRQQGAGRLLGLALGAADVPYRVCPPSAPMRPQKGTEPPIPRGSRRCATADQTRAAHSELDRHHPPAPHRSARTQLSTMSLLYMIHPRSLRPFVMH